tara:strand:- start:144 stop:1106 length:963 start_codon:yes stop_codon:yes gene_type:complete
MPKTKNILKIARSVFDIESNSISQLKSKLTDDFTMSVTEILNSDGRIIVAGVGKSANIASKIVATFNSTGQPSVFLHAADALHGDLGNIQNNDIVICISKSGNTKEIKLLVPLIKKLGNKVISICGNLNSYLAKESDFCLDVSVDKEACPNNLAPTSSTTAQLVMGDALAVCLLELRDFSDEDFARFHPGGILGKRLFLKVSDIISEQSKAFVSPNSTLQEIIVEISAKRLGSAAVINQSKLIGIITDGDLRRMLEDSPDISNIIASDIMSDSPRTISPDMLASEALTILENNNISQLIVLDNSEYKGIIHIHDILKEGI